MTTTEQQSTVVSCGGTTHVFIYLTDEHGTPQGPFDGWTCHCGQKEWHSPDAGRVARLEHELRGIRRNLHPGRNRTLGQWKFLEEVIADRIDALLGG